MWVVNPGAGNFLFNLEDVINRMKQVAVGT
jgi:hypothetical protein